MKKSIVTLLVIFCVFLLMAEEVERVRNQLVFPQMEAVTLIPFGNFDYAEINESSALVKSRTWDDVYWTLNDSGNKARIFPFNSKGEVYRAEWYKDEAGISIPNAVNIDWESMAVDNMGKLYIGACGNNSNARRDLAIYILNDPKPEITSKTRAAKTIRFYYPEQKKFPAEKLNYDCEAIFTANDKLYLLTKHRSDTRTSLYRFDSMDERIENPITKLDNFDIQGMVTDVDCTPDGHKLAVLTYTSIWVFESETDDWFNGEISWLPISAKQCEAISWNEDMLFITNEQTELFEVDPAQLIPLN